MTERKALDGFVDTAQLLKTLEQEFFRDGALDIGAISLGQRMEHLRHPERDKTLVEIQEEHVCVFVPGEHPARYPIEDFRKVLPELVSLLLRR